MACEQLTQKFIVVVLPLIDEDAAVEIVVVVELVEIVDVFESAGKIQTKHIELDLEE